MNLRIKLLDILKQVNAARAPELRIPHLDAFSE